MIKLTASDLSRLQWSLLLAVALIAAGGFMVHVSTKALRHAADTSAQAHAEREAALHKRLHAREDAEAIRANVTTYQRLQSRGILGEERRLDWIEQLNAIRTARHLPQLNYELAPQIHAAADASGPTIMISPMKASLGLLHEQDLINFLDDLQTSVPAHVRTRHCHIERNLGTGSGAASNGALLHAECELDWMTLRDPS